MNTPIYREMDRLFNNNMTVCRNTVYNWFVKGSDHLKKVLPIHADTSGMRGNLMQKALNYLNSFWNQLILYLKDGRYSIDRSSFARLLPTGRKNSLAERMLRPMTIERKRSISDRLLPKGRKNSLGFGSHAGVEVSVIYHTFIETCKMCGVSTLEYFNEFFKAIMQGRTDYENMLPMTIGIKK